MSAKKKLFYYYKSKGKYRKGEYIKRIVDVEKKDEDYLVVSLKPEFGKCSIALYNFVDFFVSKINYEKSNQEEFNSAYQKAINQLE